MEDKYQAWLENLSSTAYDPEVYLVTKSELFELTAIIKELEDYKFRYEGLCK